MNEHTGFSKFVALVHRIDSRSRLLRAWELKGGISARVTALEVEDDNGSRRKMIVRQHGTTDLQRNSNIAADEFKLLTILHTAGLPVPQPYYVETTGEVFGTPCVVLEFIEGAPDFNPTNRDYFIHTLAATLAKIHEVESANSKLAFLPQTTDLYGKNIRNRPSQLDDSIEEARIRDTLESVWPLPQRNPTALLHGDFWPGNFMWQDGKLTAIVDWEDAMLGDPLSDVANCRWELTWSLGIEAMQQFTEQYTAQRPNIDLTALPYWDLVAALRPAGQLSEWAADDTIERQMREGHRLFRERAFGALGKK